MEIDWLSHTPRADKHHPQSLGPTGKRKRGKPCLTWKRTLQAELKTISMTGEEEKRVAKDRERWKLVVRALCSRGNDEKMSYQINVWGSSCVPLARRRFAIICSKTNFFKTTHEQTNFCRLFFFHVTWWLPGQ